MVKRALQEKYPGKADLRRQGNCWTKAAPKSEDHVMRDFTSLKISRERKRCPAAGLAITHLANMRTLDQLERSAGSSTTDERQSLRAVAQRSLAPLGT